jgi:hypothetical protein
VSDRVFGWRRVALVLASARSEDLFTELGMPSFAPNARSWARHLLDQVKDFYEVYETDPDGGAVADAIEADLAQLFSPAVLPSLREGAELFSRPIDGDLDDWSKVFLDLQWQDHPDNPFPRIPMREELRSKVLKAVGDPDPGEVWQPPPQAIEDEWDVSFADRHDVWAAEIANQWSELRWTWTVARRLLELLTPTERDELEAWAQQMLYSGPRPEPWPPAPRMDLAHAARNSGMTFGDPADDHPPPRAAEAD